MSKFTVDSFIVELGFNENVIKGLQRVVNRPGNPGD